MGGKGLLLLNTGSPESPKRKQVRAFIEAMLMDPLVMTLPSWQRTLLVKGIIGPFRQFSSSKKYQLIWDKEQNKSALLYNMEKLRDSLKEKLNIPVEIGMRYLNPSIEDAFYKLIANKELTELVVLPLFPHYAESSYQTVVDEVKRVYTQSNVSIPLTIIEPYFNHPAYIKALAISVAPYITKLTSLILFNFHSLPLEHVQKGHEKGKEFDYIYQTKETVKLLRQELKLPANVSKMVFSSAFGRNWLEPFLLDKIKDLAENGVENILVIAPGFASDNLETLYDIEFEARKLFLDSGGKRFVYVPCLNYTSEWVEAIQTIIQ